jgi:hypothetical protein
VDAEGDIELRSEALYLEPCLVKADAFEKEVNYASVQATYTCGEVTGNTQLTFVADGNTNNLIVLVGSDEELNANVFYFQK